MSLAILLLSFGGVLTALALILLSITQRKLIHLTKELLLLVEEYRKITEDLVKENDKLK